MHAFTITDAVVCAQASTSSRRPARQRRLAALAQAGGSGSSGGGPAALVSLTVPECRLAFGEHLRVVGSCPELGGWDAQQAPSLAWQEGDNWAAALALPPGQHAFKLVVVRQDGSQQWEDGADRSLAVAPAGAVRLTCRFGDTGATWVEEGGAALGDNLQVRWVGK